MNEQILIISLGVVLVIAVAYLIGRLQSRTPLPEISELPPNLIAIYQEIQATPAKVLATIQGSINPQKGKVAELLTYAELRYDYDKIVPLGSPIDFIGIKHGEKIDFIEVKSGGAVLSNDEKEIRKLIAAGRVNFRLITVKDQAAEAVSKLE
jgi:hypothetical protein